MVVEPASPSSPRSVKTQYVPAEGEPEDARPRKRNVLLCSRAAAVALVARQRLGSFDPRKRTPQQQRAANVLGRLLFEDLKHGGAAADLC